MIILENSTIDAGTISRNFGLPEYSYWFVRKAFRPILDRFGVVIPLSSPEQEVDRIYQAAQAHGQSCIYVSFNPPDHMKSRLKCPTIPVFAWEYDTIPDEIWDDDPRNDWSHVLSGMPAAITHSRFSVEAVQRSLGPGYPVWSIPAPIADRYRPYAATARGWREPFELTLGGALVFDSWRLDLGLFTYGDDARSTRALRMVQTTATERGSPLRHLQLEGVVYSSVFNPADGRKNWEDMVAGFIYAFRHQPLATLILKTSHRDIAEGVLPLLQDMAKLGAFSCRIVIVHGLLSEDDYRALVEATSYTVNASQGEGQCLPLMEFMSAGRPAVAPNHTAMAEYVSAENAFIIAAHQRPAFWPHDMRQAHRCLRFQVEFADLVRRYRESFEVARHDPARYAAMSRAATAALLSYCSDEVVTAGMARVLAHLGLGPKGGVSPAKDRATHERVSYGA